VSAPEIQSFWHHLLSNDERELMALQSYVTHSALYVCLAQLDVRPHKRQRLAPPTLQLAGEPATPERGVTQPDQQQLVEASHKDSHTIDDLILISTLAHREDG
jgi:hypothetical protein